MKFVIDYNCLSSLRRQPCSTPWTWRATRATTPTTPRRMRKRRGQSITSVQYRVSVLYWQNSSVFSMLLGMTHWLCNVSDIQFELHGVTNTSELGFAMSTENQTHRYYIFILKSHSWRPRVDNAESGLKPQSHDVTESVLTLRSHWWRRRVTDDAAESVLTPQSPVNAAESLLTLWFYFKIVSFK